MTVHAMTVTSLTHC